MIKENLKLVLNHYRFIMNDIAIHSNDSYNKEIKSTDTTLEDTVLSEVK